MAFYVGKPQKRKKAQKGTILKKLLVIALIIGAFLLGCVVGAHDVLTTQIISKDEQAHQYVSEYKGHLYAQWYE